jgi:hypothetical protein
MTGGRNPFIYISGVFAGAWVVAAWLRPDADYVFFPVLVAGSFPVSYRLGIGRIPPALAAAAAVGGIANVIIVALFLALAGVLGPPILLPAFGAVGQATVLGVTGAALGYVASANRSDRGS